MWHAQSKHEGLSQSIRLSLVSEQGSQSGSQASKKEKVSGQPRGLSQQPTGSWPTKCHLMMRRQHHTSDAHRFSHLLPQDPFEPPTPHSPRRHTSAPRKPITMSSIAAMASRRAFARQSFLRAPPRRFYSSKVEEAGLDKGPKRDPELYVLLGVMSGAFLLAGWYFGRKPTSVTSESNVRIGESAMPWEQADESGKVYKYQYHPHGDKSQPLRNAPSALNTVIVPNVTLPVDLHERYNKYGKEEWDY